MREFKFRVFENGEMYYMEEPRKLVRPILRYGSPKTIQGLILGNNWGDADGITEDRMKEGDIKIMQWTGLKDKNGKDIYEGDIIDINSERHSLLKVFYRCGSAAFQLKRLGTNIILPMNILYDCHNYDVVGNVFENKELLGVKQDE